MTRLLSALLIVSLVAGCATMEPVYPARKIIMQTVHTGDHVRIATRNGTLAEFKVTEVDLDGLAGTDQRVPYDDIVQLEVRKVHSGKTTGLVLGIVGGVAAALFVILLVVVASEGGFGFPEN